jgi:tetratricopeptide (TPR) repeat protein
MRKTIIIGLLFFMVACATLRVSTPSFEKVYSEVDNSENRYFWEQFHKGNLNNLDSIINKLDVAYKIDSTNVLTNAHLGFAHIWALSEWQRIPNVGSQIKEHAYLSYKHFSKAYELNPNDKRILGFLGDIQMAYGSISGSKKMQRKGYFKGLKSIKEWPEFNKFTIGVTFAGSNPNSKFFQKALDWQWTTLEDCFTSTIDKTNPNLKEFISKEIPAHNLGRDRACYNSWIAPHNIEGYFLHMGDMITKTGDYTTAIKIYELAKSSPNYNTWTFKEILNNRIINAERNTKTFLDKTQKGIDNVIINNSGNLCMSCHKMSKDDNEIFKNYNWAAYFKTNDIYSINGLKK